MLVLLSNFNIFFITTFNTSYNVSFSFYDNTFSDYKHPMVGVQVFPPCPLNSKLPLLPWLLLSRVPPNLELDCLHFDLSYFPLLSTARDLLPRSLEASPSYYIPELASANSLQAEQPPFLASLPMHLNPLPYARDYCFV